MSSAEPRDSPVTSGTSTCSGPLLTLSVTRLPRSTEVPCRGKVRMAVPSGTLSEASALTVTSKPAFSRVLMAWERVWPSTEGTRALPGPFETTSVTVEPSSASSPALGS